MKDFRFFPSEGLRFKYFSETMIIIELWTKWVTYVCMKRWFSEINPNFFIPYYFTYFYCTPSVRKNYPTIVSCSFALQIYVFLITCYLHFWNQIIIVVSKSLSWWTLLFYQALHKSLWIQYLDFHFILFARLGMHAKDSTSIIHAPPYSLSKLHQRTKWSKPL